MVGSRKKGGPMNNRYKARQVLLLSLARSVASVLCPRMAPQLPNHQLHMWRKDCDREFDALRHAVNYKLQTYQLEGQPDTHTKRRQPTEFDSGLPRPVDSSASLHPSAASLHPSASQSQFAGTHGSSRAPSYLMLTSSSAISLRGGGRSGNLHKSVSSSSLLSEELPGLSQTGSYGYLAKGQPHWQPTPKSFASLPSEQLLDARWPSILHGALAGRPLRPELRHVSSTLQADNVRWIGGAWRPRVSNSPRTTPI